MIEVDHKAKLEITSSERDLYGCAILVDDELRVEDEFAEPNVPILLALTTISAV